MADANRSKHTDHEPGVSAPADESAIDKNVDVASAESAARGGELRVLVDTSVDVHVLASSKRAARTVVKSRDTPVTVTTAEASPAPTVGVKEVAATARSDDKRENKEEEE